MHIPFHIRQRCLFLSDQIKQGIPFDDQQKKFVSSVFSAIGNGADPRTVFGAEQLKGKRKIDEQRKEKIRMVLQRVSLDLALAKQEKRKLTITNAINAHLAYANRLMGYRPDRPVITTEQVKRWWYTPAYATYRLLDDQFKPL
jgi:hypothetical protein